MYEPYCANYTMASEIMLQEEHNLTVRLVFLGCPGRRDRVSLVAYSCLPGGVDRRLIISST